MNEQLGDMEVKPSTSLWDRIDSGITSDSFESGVQSSLENFEQMPYPETWDKIAAELPEPKLGNGLIKYYIIAALAVLFSAGIYIGQSWQSESAPLIAQQQSSQQPPISAEEAQPEQLASNNTNLAVTAVESNEESPVVKKDEKAIGEDAVASNDTKPALSNQQAGSQLSAPVVSKELEPNKANKQTNIQTSVPAVSNGAEPATFNKQTGVQTAAPVLAAQKETNSAPEQTSEVSDKGRGVNATATITNKPEGSGNKSVAPVVALVPIQQAASTPPTDNNKIVREEPVIPAEPIQTIHQKEVVATVPPTLNQPRELTEVKPDSALYAQKMQTYQEQPQAETFSPFSISVLAGAHLSYTTYGAPKESSSLNFEKNIELRKELERPDIDWAGGFLLDYRINNKWMLSSGIAMVNFSQKFEYDIEKAQDPNVKNEVNAPTTNPADSFVAGNTYSNRIKFSWTEIPLYVNYTIMQKNGWNIDMQAGVSYAFINTVDGGMIGYDNKGVLVLKGEESFPNIKNTVFVTAMPQVSYQFAPSISLGLVPTVKYSLTSIIGNEYWIQQHPYFIGMNICLRKRF